MNEKQIKNLPSKDVRYKVYLGENLLIEVMPSGAKYFRVKRGNSTKTLGQFPKIGLKEARILASDVLGTMDSIRKEPSSSQVFLGLLKDYTEAQEWADSTRKRHMQRIKLYIEPYFKNITLNRVSRLYLVEFVKHVQVVACAETASKSLNLVKQVLDYAVLCGYIELNPSLGLSAIIKKPKARPMPAFTKEADIRRLMCALDVYPHEVVKSLMLFTIYTLGRPSECRLAKWGEIEGDLWTVPSERMKMRKEHIVPLSRQAQEILEGMKQYKQSDFIFPSLRGGRALSDNALLVALRTMGFSKDKICVHGFRSMGSTVLNEQGYRHDVIEKALAHAGEDKIRAIYNRAEYLEERRQMLQGYSDWLEGLL